MSINFSEKIKLIRKSEYLTQDEFSKLTGIKKGTLRSYEQNTHTISAENIIKILKNNRLEKYTFWFILDKTASEAGQIEPALAGAFKQNKTLDELIDSYTDQINYDEENGNKHG